MKEFLFLYPVKAYIENSYIPRIERLHPNMREKIFGINDIIDARYRQQGFTINWLMFQPSAENDFAEESKVSQFIHIQPHDRLLDSQITTEQTNPPLLKHADPEFVLSQLPQPIDELIIGGFHLGDCVDKIASFAYQRGIQVFVDEDTTEHFFTALVLRRKIPLMRTKWTLTSLGVSKEWLEFVRRHRVNKPWLIQT